MERDFRTNEEFVDGRDFVWLKTKRREGEDYPSNPGSGVAISLPVVYSNVGWDFNGVATFVGGIYPGDGQGGTYTRNYPRMTASESQRRDQVYCRNWHCEGAVICALRTGNRLVAVQFFGTQSVVGCDLDGIQQWKADYWDGSDGTFQASFNPALVSRDVPHCGLDSNGNTYVAGPSARLSGRSDYWSLISYDPYGIERWRKDIRGQKKLYEGGSAIANWSGNAYDVVVTGDDVVCVLCEAYRSSFVAGNEYTPFFFNPDGTPATAKTIVPTSWGSSINAAGFFPIDESGTIGLRGWGSTGMACVARPGTSGRIVVGYGGELVNQGLTNTAYPTVAELTPPQGPAAFPEPAPNGYKWGYYGRRDEPNSSVNAGVIDVAISPDGNDVYCCGVNLITTIGGTRYTYLGSLAKLIPVTVEYPWLSDNAYWHIDGSAGLMKGTADGVVIAGAGLTKRSRVDGSLLWSHPTNIVNTTGFDLRGDHITVCGSRRNL